MLLTHLNGAVMSTQFDRVRHMLRVVIKAQQSVSLITSLPVLSHVVNALKCVDGKKKRKKKGQVKLK